MRRLLPPVLVLLLLTACAGCDADRLNDRASPTDPVLALTAYVPASPPTIVTPTSVNQTPVALHLAPQRASRVAPSPRRSTPTPDLSALLDRLAQCESGRNPRAHSGPYWGAFQFLVSTWRSLGMGGNPIDFDYSTQKATAARIPVSAWHRQFPVCSRRIGA